MWLSLIHFPFDETECNFYLSLRTLRNNSIRLTNDRNSVTYIGPTTLNEFKVVKFWSTTSQSETETTFIYSFMFRRLFECYLLTIFFQPSILFFLSYITLYIDENDFSNRFMGSVTALLVLAALLASLEDLLPKTAYFKFIDFWFNWFIGNILFIILIHVVIDYLNKKQHMGESVANSNSTMQFQQNGDLPLFTRRSASSLQKQKLKDGVMMNRIFKIVLPVCNIAFIFFYFLVNIRYQKK